MPFYLGNYRANVYLGNQLCNFLINVNKTTNIIPNNALISLDDYYLKDRNNIYLICLDEDNESGQLLLTADGEIITTLSGQRVIVQKGEE